MQNGIEIAPNRPLDEIFARQTAFAVAKTNTVGPEFYEFGQSKIGVRSKLL
jgi:hypothetical protein